VFTWRDHTVRCGVCLPMADENGTYVAGRWRP
jgi:hypothetical protein